MYNFAQILAADKEKPRRAFGRAGLSVAVADQAQAACI
jgi:hypothetical protein